MIFSIESSFCALSTRFEPLYTNIYLTELINGAVSPYEFRLKIYGATSVQLSSVKLVVRGDQKVLPI